MDYYRTIYSIFIEDNNNNVWKLSAIPPSISRKKRQLRFNPRWGPNHRTDDGTQRIILLEIPFTCKMAAVVCSWHAPPPTLSPPFPSFSLPPSLPLAEAALPFPRRERWRGALRRDACVKRPNSLPPPHAHYTGPCFSRRNGSPWSSVERRLARDGTPFQPLAHTYLPGLWKINARG